MAKAGGGRKKHGGEIGGLTQKVSIIMTKYSTPITIILLIIVTAIGAYLRALPAMKYGLELDANDPWIAYWEAQYFHTHGLFNFSGLERVREFWWPVGRNFLHTDYLGVAWLAAATYKIGAAFGLSLKGWIALFPVFAGTLAIVFLFILVYVATGSKLGGLVTATLFALSPGAISRTSAGFVEKTGIAVPVLALFYTFLILALRNKGRRSLTYAVLAGLTGGSIVYLWGGYHLVSISLALIPLLDPIFAAPSKRRLIIYLTVLVSYAVVAVIAPHITMRYFIMGLGAASILGIGIYALEVYIDRLPLTRRILENGVTPGFQVWLLVVLFIAGFIAIYSGLAAVNDRLLLAVGIRHLNPLIESVQEHQPVSFARIIREYGLALVLALGGMALFLVRLAQGEVKFLDGLTKSFFYLMALFLLFANKQLAYFTQMASLYMTIAAGLATADFVSGSVEPVGRAKKAKKKARTHEHEVADPLKVLAGMFIVLLVVLGAAYYGVQSYRTNEYRAPQILTSGIGPLSIFTPSGKSKVLVPLNRAWLNALAWIKNNTKPDALIVSWWDYGYWITVNTGRKTVADGATLNGTQIRALARLLTGDEGEANYILKYIFKAEPNNTYVVFYDVFEGVVDKANNMTLLYPKPNVLQEPQAGIPGAILHGMADFPKSTQMLRIAYRIPPFARSVFQTAYSSMYVDNRGQRWLEFPGLVGQPKENVTRVRNALLYKMAINGIESLPKTAVPDATCASILNGTKTALMAVAAARSPTGGYQLQYVFTTPLKSFKPVAVSISCPIVNQVGNRYNVFAVVVFIFQWTG